MKHIKTINEIIGGIDHHTFTYGEVKEIAFNAFIVGMDGTDSDRQEFENWWRENSNDLIIKTFKNS